MLSNYECDLCWRSIRRLEVVMLDGMRFVNTLKPLRRPSYDRSMKEENHLRQRQRRLQSVPLFVCRVGDSGHGQAAA